MLSQQALISVECLAVLQWWKTLRCGNSPIPLFVMLWQGGVLQVC